MAHTYSLGSGPLSLTLFSITLTILDLKMLKHGSRLPETAISEPQYILRNLIRFTNWHESSCEIYSQKCGGGRRFLFSWSWKHPYILSTSTFLQVLQEGPRSVFNLEVRSQKRSIRRHHGWRQTRKFYTLLIAGNNHFRVINLPPPPR
jgi:hypothetical protein